ncbi:DUF4189 domain-containing protein [Stenotrophomonas sp. S41]|nr:DUF4189 domain-containing protein [Stenotrophomonas sp. S41]
MITVIRCLAVLSVLISPVAVGQQPGSPQYNSVLLPAIGEGDTRGAPQRWGAIARGDDRILGWSASGRTEQEAGDLAIKDCLARGSTNCVVLDTFVNSCGAVAAGPTNRRYEFAPKSLNSVRRKALKNCGPDCKIIFEGCALP